LQNSQVNHAGNAYTLTNKGQRVFKLRSIDEKGTCDFVHYNLNLPGAESVAMQLADVQTHAKRYKGEVPTAVHGDLSLCLLYQQPGHHLECLRIKLFMFLLAVSKENGVECQTVLQDWTLGVNPPQICPKRLISAGAVKICVYVDHVSSIQDNPSLSRIPVKYRNRDQFHVVVHDPPKQDNTLKWPKASYFNALSWVGVRNKLDQVNLDLQYINVETDWHIPFFTNTADLAVGEALTRFGPGRNSGRLKV